MWTNYRNRYWPAECLIDANSAVRHIKFGEDGYSAACGPWTIRARSAGSDNSAIKLNFHANNVYIVVGANGALTVMRGEKLAPCRSGSHQRRTRSSPTIRWHPEHLRSGPARGYRCFLSPTAKPLKPVTNPRPGRLRTNHVEYSPRRASHQFVKEQTAMKIHHKIAATSFTAAGIVGLAVALTPTAAAADLVGPGCADYAGAHPTGPASVDGMAQDPVAVAASNNPELTTLTAALSGKLNPQVNLVDTLNNGEYTVFAPTDAAFNKLPASTIEQLKTNAPMLSSILTYHVVAGQVSPAKIVGTWKTLQGASVTASGQGNNLKVNNAGLVCGGVPTANATVYMIDTVLMPPGQ